MIPEQAQDEWEPALPPYTPETVIEDIILSYPASVIREVFDELELHCFDCAVGPHDDLSDVARLHRIDEETLIEQLSKRLEPHDPLDQPSYFDEA